MTKSAQPRSAGQPKTLFTSAFWAPRSRHSPRRVMPVPARSISRHAPKSQNATSMRISPASMPCSSPASRAAPIEYGHPLTCRRQIAGRCLPRRSPPLRPTSCSRSLIRRSSRHSAWRSPRRRARPRSPKLSTRPGVMQRAGALSELLASAQTTRLIGPGEPAEMATQYLGLVWEGLMVGLLLGVAATPGPAEAERRATRATAAFMQLHPDPATNG